jgi:ATP-dependent Zn protease
MTEENSKKESVTATAYHEAGHAVMALLVGRPVEKVTISPAHLQTGGIRLGACKVQKGRTKASQDGVEDEVLILLAGMVAERHFTDRYCLAGADQDLRFAQRVLANRAPTERQMEKLMRRLLDKTEHLLNDAVNAKAVQLIAAELVEKETVSGRAVRHFYNQAAS